MDKVPLEERLANSAGRFKRQAPYIVVFCVLLTGILLAQLVVSPPTFQTDLGDFAPESESSNAHDRIHENFPDETRPMFVHVTADDGSNVLSIASILAMNDDLKVFENASEMRQDIVSVWTKRVTVKILEAWSHGHKYWTFSLMKMKHAGSLPMINCCLRQPMPRLPYCTTTSRLMMLVRISTLEMALLLHLLHPLSGFLKSTLNWKSIKGDSCNHK